MLVVEDDTAIRECIAEALEMEGDSVSQARDGREGQEACEHPPNLIVLDLMVPGMNGWQFRAAQKKDPAFADIPVIITSAVAEPWSDMEEVAALFPKPFDRGAKQVSGRPSRA